MNFGKAKKILIFLFLFINIFLIFLLAGHPGRYSLQKESVLNTIEIAKRNHVTVSADILPYTYTKLDTLTLYNPLVDKKTFSQTFKGVTYEKDGTFSLPVNQSLEKMSADSVLHYLNKKGFGIYQLSHVQTVHNPVTNEKIYTYTQKYNSYMISGATILVYANGKTLTKIKGNIYEITNKDKSDYNILSPLQIIISFSNDASSFSKKATIKEISQSYYIPLEAKSYKNITAVPCYILRVNKNLFYYDAIQNTFLYSVTNEGVLIENIIQAFQLI